MNGLKEKGRPRPVDQPWGEGVPFPWRRFALSAALSLAMGLSVVTGAETKIDAKRQPNLGPEVEAKLTEFLGKANETKRRHWAERMQREIDELAETTGLGADARERLRPLVEQLIESSVRAWSPKFSEWLRSSLSPYVGQPEAVDQMLSQMDQPRYTDFFGGYFRPFEDPKWAEEIKAILPPAQTAAWEKARAERKDAVLRETAEVLKKAIEQTRAGQELALASKVESIKMALALTKDRAAQLDAIAKAAVETALGNVRKRAERNVLAMEKDQREEVVRSGLHVPLEESDIAVQKGAWEAGVAKLLSAGEGSRLRGMQEEYRERQSKALAGVLIAQLDEQVAFTESQRAHLRPLIEREVRADPSVLPSENEQPYYQINLGKLFVCGRMVKAEELQTILDETQRQRWQEACSGKSSLPRSAVGMIRIFGAAAPAAPANPSARPGEPEDVENAISDHFYEKAATERKRLLAINVLKAEDAARVAGLSPPAARQLAIAARGTAEGELAVWKANTDQSLRSQLQDVTPENVKQRLASLDRYNYGRRSGGDSELGALWEATVQAELTEAQRAAWKKEIDARGGWRDEAIANLIMAELDRRIALTTEQWGKLEPQIGKMVKEYGPDIGTMFSSSYSNIWYLQSHSMFLPVMAVPEKELKDILSKEQWERWTGGVEFGNTTNYWENVQRMHTSRVREKKP